MKGSSLERDLEGYLKAQGAEYTRQHLVGRRRVDFYIPSQRLFLEADGPTFHDDPKAERKRDLEILLQSPDHKIAHVLYGHNPPKWEVFDLHSLNHEEAYQFASRKVSSVRRRAVGAYAEARGRLYNLAVLEDESYVTLQAVAHNCRCILVFYTPEELDILK